MGYDGTIGVDIYKLNLVIYELEQEIQSAQKDRSYLMIAKDYGKRASEEVEAAIAVLDQTVRWLEWFRLDLKKYKESVEEFDQRFSQELSNIRTDQIANSNLPTDAFSVLWKEAGYISRYELQNKFPTFIGIEKGTKVEFFGGNQDWFKEQVGIDGGCGTTAAANILAYLALNNPDVAKALGIESHILLTKDGYTAFMERVYRVVTPFKVLPAGIINDLFKTKIPITFGIWPVSSMADQTVRFAKENGINLTYKSLTVSDISVKDLWNITGLPELPRNPDLPRNSSAWNWTPISYEAGIKFIQEGLDKDCPVALLNTFNEVEMKGTGKNKTSEMHWVTITKIEYDATVFDYNLTVSSWGEEYSISYNELHKSWKGIKAIDSGMVYFELEE